MPKADETSPSETETSPSETETSPAEPETVPETVPAETQTAEAPDTVRVSLLHSGVTVSTPGGFVAVPAGESDQPLAVRDALVVAGFLR